MIRARRRRRLPALVRAGLIVLALVAATLAPRIAGDAMEQAGLAAFYQQPPDALDGPPGTIVRSEPLVGHPLVAKAWRIMYRTTGLDGERVVATGIVATPLGEPPPDGRTVLAWGHPTTGTAETCAPSRSFDPFLDIEQLRAMLDRGYTVVATDYVGMGTDGPPSYLVGITAGNSVLDSVRAARSLEAAQAGRSVVLWGHSQGGQAVLFAAQRAPTYAPELDIRAVAVAAPAADLTALLTSHLDDVSGVTIGSYAFQAYSRAYADRGAGLDLILTSPARQLLPTMNRLCLLSHLSELHALAAPVIGQFYAADPGTTEPWASLLRENSAGGTIKAPLFVAQGLSDSLVLPSDTERFIDLERRLGVIVQYQTIPEADHGTIAYLAIPSLHAWLNSLGV